MTMTAIDVVVIVLCVLVVVGVAVGWAIRKKKGKTGCCGECAHCSSACPSAPKAQDAQDDDRAATHSSVAAQPAPHACSCCHGAHAEGHAHGCCACASRSEAGAPSRKKAELPSDK